MLFARFARKVIQSGGLTIIDAGGRRHVVGGPGGPAATIRLHDKALHYWLAINPTLYVGEAYMDGTLTIEQGSLHDFLTICAINVDRAFEQPLMRALAVGARILRHLH
jgi:cyclopropane-fatty-acyl-phospholipid synthase